MTKTSRKNAIRTWGLDATEDSLCDRTLEYLSSLGVGLVNVHGTFEDGACTCRSGIKCASPGKHPQMGRGWQTKKINVNDNNNTWKTQQQKRRVGSSRGNIGIKTGYVAAKGKNLIVVDVDDSAHPLLRTLFDSRTLCVRTGSGGYHFYFWSEKSFGNSVSKISSNIDIRGTNGFVVGPGSFHVSGGRYIPLADKDSEFEVKDVPESILRLMHANPSRDMDKSKNNALAAYKAAVAKKKTSDPKPKQRKKRSISISQESNEYAWMVKCDVVDLIDRLTKEKDLIVPRGMRHVVMTRLVGHEINRLHAKKIGIRTFQRNIAFYRKKFSGFKKDFLALEVKKIVDDLIKKDRMKIRYNTKKRTLDRVAGYAQFMSSRKVHIPEHTQVLLRRADEYFFKYCLKEDELGIRNKKNFLPLREIIKRHKAWVKSRIGYAFSYSEPDMAVKLKEMGFYRTLWYNTPLWSCQFDELNLEKGFKIANRCDIINDTAIAIPLTSFSETLKYIKQQEDKAVDVTNLTEEVTKNMVPSLNKDDIKYMTIVNKSAKKTKSILEDEETEKVTNPDTESSGSLPSKIKIRRKKHPQEPKYPGRPNLEMSTAFSQFLFLLTPEQGAELGNDSLILDLEGTAEEAQEIRVGDKLGIALRFDNGYVPTVLEVQSTDPGAQISESIYSCVDRYTKSEVDFTFQELSIARAMGYYDVLFRDGKLYGVPEFEELNVKFAVGDKVFDPSNPDDLAAFDEAVNKEKEQQAQSEDPNIVVDKSET